MGRSYLSVKLALLFGVVVAVLVTVHVGSGNITMVPSRDADAEMSASGVPGAEAAAEAPPCLWRGCPASLTHPLLKGSMPEPIQRRRVVAAELTRASS